VEAIPSDVALVKNARRCDDSRAAPFQK